MLFSRLVQRVRVGRTFTPVARHFSQITQNNFKRRGALVFVGACGIFALPCPTAYCSSDHGHGHGHANDDKTRELFRGNYKDPEMNKPLPRYLGIFSAYLLAFVVVFSGTIVL